MCGTVKCDMDTQDTHPCMCVLMAGMSTLVETSDHTHIYGHGRGSWERVLWTVDFWGRPRLVLMDQSQVSMDEFKIYR